MRPRSGFRRHVVLLAVYALLFASRAESSEPHPPWCPWSYHEHESDQRGVGRVSVVRVGTPECESCPPVSCRSDSVQVKVWGALSGCEGIAAFEEVAATGTTPTLRLRINAATGGACPDVVNPFCAHVSLRPGFAPKGEFTLQVVVAAPESPPRVLEDTSTVLRVSRPFQCRHPHPQILGGLRASLNAHLGLFGRRATITVTLSQDSDGELSVHDVAGRRVATIASGRFPSGESAFAWDGVGNRDGVYFALLRVGGQVISRRLILLRDAD